MGVISKEKALEELMKCSIDPVYFLDNYGKVKDPIKGYVKLKLYDFQEKTIRDYEAHRFNAILKSRQMGLSTITAGYAAWLICFHKAKDVVVIANKKDAANNFITKIKVFVNNAPDWLVPNIIIDNRGSIELSNNSRIAAYATTSDAGRSESLSLLIIDEAAIISTSKVEDLWTSVSPTLFLGGQCIAISTPNGVGNFFHKTYVEGEQGLNSFHSIKHHWTKHPIYSLGMYFGEKGEVRSPWYDKETFGKSARDIAQEFDCSFVGSGNNVIDEEYVREQRKNIRNPIRAGGFDGNFWIFEECIPEEVYLIGADVARGDGQDWSAAHVFKHSNNEQVAEYRGKLPPDTFAKLLFVIGAEYNNALLIPEANSIGFATCLKLVEMKYPNIHYTLPCQGLFKTKEYYKNSLKNSMIPGFQTTSANRPLAVGQLEEEVRNKSIIIHSSRLMSEFDTFVWINSKPQAMGGYNDDLVMSAAIVQLVRATTLKSIIKSKNMTTEVLQNMKDMKSSSGNDAVKKLLNIQQRKSGLDPYITYDPSGEEVDLRWLLK
jgi:hypothetical protein